MARYSVMGIPEQASIVGDVARKMWDRQLQVWDGVQELVSGVAAAGPYRRLEVRTGLCICVRSGVRERSCLGSRGRVHIPVQRYCSCVCF